MEIQQNTNLTSNWITETARSNAVDFGCSLSIMSYLSFAVISIYTVVNVNNVRYLFYEITIHYCRSSNNMIFVFDYVKPQCWNLY